MVGQLDDDAAPYGGRKRIRRPLSRCRWHFPARRAKKRDKLILVAGCPLPNGEFVKQIRGVLTDIVGQLHRQSGAENA